MLLKEPMTVLGVMVFEILSEQVKCLAEMMSIKEPLMVFEIPSEQVRYLAEMSMKGPLMVFEMPRYLAEMSAKGPLMAPGMLVKKENLLGALAVCSLMTSRFYQIFCRLCLI